MIPAAILRAALAGCLAALIGGCGDELPQTKLGRAAAAMFDAEGYIKDKEKNKFIARDDPAKEKIDLMLQIIKNGPTVKHGAAAEVIALINDPYRIDALIGLLDNYKGTEESRANVMRWAARGLAFSLEPRAYDKLFELLQTSQSPLELGTVLHDIGLAPLYPEILKIDKELSDELYDKIEDNIRKCLNHDDLSVREHANRALDRLHGKLDDT